MTFENVAAASRKVKCSSADRLRALVAYIRTYAMSINGRAIKTGGYASMPDGNRCQAKRAANLYPPPPLPPSGLCSPLREIDANCANGRQLFCISKLLAYYILYFQFIN